MVFELACIANTSAKTDNIFIWINKNKKKTFAHPCETTPNFFRKPNQSWRAVC